MKTTLERNALLFVACTILMVGFALAARWVESGFGLVHASQVTIADPSGVTLTAKLYKPNSARPDNPKPAVLLLHGFQNDKETEGAFAIELSRRGFVVLALDETGHGDSDAAVTKDDSMGGNAAYAYLKTLDYVDATNLGVSGHSMGAGTTLAVGAANPDHQALNPKCGSAGSPELNNVLLTQARFEEFRGFRENQPRVEGLTTNPDRLADFGLAGPVEWNTTYGSFADGSARRQALVNTVHPGVTHAADAVTEGVLWMQQALMDGQSDAEWIPADEHIYMWKEWFTLLALLAALLALLPLTNLLLLLPFFKSVTQPLPGGFVATGWWKKALTNTLIAGLTWPLLAAVGAFAITALLPGMRMIIANGVLAWYLGNVLIYLIIFAFWYRKARRQGLSMAQLGMGGGWGNLVKTLLLGSLLVGVIYAIEGLCQALWGIEFRFLWPFMRQFTPERFAAFLVYLVPAFLFFILNGGVFLFGQARQPEYETEGKTFIIWWLKNCFAGIFGLFLIWALQYVPYLYLNMAPGFELIGLPLFGEMIPLLLFVYIPEFIVLFALLTWFYRRTGRVFLGAWVVACLAMWFLTAGTAIV